MTANCPLRMWEGHSPQGRQVNQRSCGGMPDWSPPPQPSSRPLDVYPIR